MTIQIAKDISSQKIYRIHSLNTEVVEDDWNHGEGDYVNSWSGGEVLGKKMYQSFNSLADIFSMINEYYLDIWNGADNIKNWFISEDLDHENKIRFDCDTLVDKDNIPADESDIKSWKKGEKKLFNAHSILYVTSEHVKPASTAEIIEDAMKLGLETI